MAHWTDGLAHDPTDPVGLLQRLRTVAGSDAKHKRRIDGAVHEALAELDRAAALQVPGLPRTFQPASDPVMLANIYVRELLKGEVTDNAAAAAASLLPNAESVSRYQSACAAALRAAHDTIWQAVRRV
jgi:hypothetical protein